MVKQSKGEKIFNFINILIMLIAVIAVIIPLFSVVSTSLVSNQELSRRRFIIFPQKVDFTAYKIIFEGTSIIISGYKITIFRVVVGTVINLIFSYFTAYAMSKKDLPGRNVITIFFFFTMLFGGGLIPYYIVIKSVRLLNNVWVYILPQIISVWNTLLIRNFIMNIPESLEESAEIDGANAVHIIFRIILPLSIPALVTIGLFYAVGHWNSWWDAFLFVSDVRKQPIQLVLRNILASAEMRINTITGRIDATEIKPPSRAIQTATIVVTTVPIVIIYPFIQKYFIKGIMIGAVKG
ncbi:MAG TPA: carbohydrate ABC transporter permease [Clostridiales bacterium]|nr:carbohydrate ABC transporter permease [Clostridiales bacterium]